MFSAYMFAKNGLWNNNIIDYLDNYIQLKTHQKNQCTLKEKKRIVKKVIILKFYKEKIVHKQIFLCNLIKQNKFPKILLNKC